MTKPKGILKDTTMQSMGGKARAKALSPERRKEIARKAIKARWDKQSKK